MRRMSAATRTSAISAGIACVVVLVVLGLLEHIQGAEPAERNRVGPREVGNGAALPQDRCRRRPVKPVVARPKSRRKPHSKSGRLARRPAGRPRRHCRAAAPNQS